MTPQLAPDAVVPQRDRLLDERWMQQWFADRLGVRAAGRGACRLVRAKYRIGESLRVRYDLDTGARRLPLAVRVFPPGVSRSIYERSLARALPVNGVPPVVHDPALEMVAWVFPNDRKISRLADVMAPLRCGRDEPTQAELVSWVPEKLATARHATAGETAHCYAKIYGDQTPLPPVAAMRAIAGVHATPLGPMRLPAVLATSDDQRLLTIEAGPGRLLATLPAACREQALRHLGAALATLHTTTPPAGLPTHDRLGVARIERAAELLGKARPDLAPRAAALARCLRVEARPAAPDVLVHGDVHARNVLCARDSITLIDLDQVALGPAAADLASVLASLACEQSSGSSSAANAARLGHALCDGYALVRPLPDRAALGWHVRAAVLVERCLRAVNRVRTDELAHLAAYLDHALRAEGDGLYA